MAEIRQLDTVHGAKRGKNPIAKFGPFMMWHMVEIQQRDLDCPWHGMWRKSDD